jgi:hypothetical protein
VVDDAVRIDRPLLGLVARRRDVLDLDGLAGPGSGDQAASRPSAASSFFSAAAIEASNGAMPLSRRARMPSKSEQPSAGVSRSGRVRRWARSTWTQPSSTETSRYSPGSPSGGPTWDKSSRSASSSSRSAPSRLASFSTGTPSGCFAT